ncbi:hypothetical protein DsansV1_C32g0220841 [Dioscorea sansibarensis]
MKHGRQWSRWCGGALSLTIMRNACSRHSRSEVTCDSRVKVAESFNSVSAHVRGRWNGR